MLTSFLSPSPQYIGNASLQVLQSPWHLNADGESFSPRLRLVTSGDAEQDQYELSWSVSWMQEQILRHPSLSIFRQVRLA